MPQVPLPKHDLSDIYDYGFDKNLNRTLPVGEGGTTVYDIIQSTALDAVKRVLLLAGTVGDFSIGVDYIRDTANSMGLASTVTGSDDVRFWSGSTFANRATAPFRVTRGGALIATSATISGYVVAQSGTFGGDGSDGALSVSSGTTTIDLGGSSFVVRNYTSISITGTGALAFSNPHANGTRVILKSQGAVVLTSTATRLIDLRGIGSSGGTQVGENTNGNPGNDYADILDSLDHFGSGGTGVGDSPNGGAGGAAGAVISTTGGVGVFYTTASDRLQSRVLFMVPGVGGASGGGGGTRNVPSTGGNGSAGGAGGGSLLIECAGALNFSGTIDISGNVGSNGGTGTSSSADFGAGGGGGGGGGSAGWLAILYRTLTANTGVITNTGGAGGSGGTRGADSTNVAGGGGGGGGGSLNTGVAGSVGQTGGGTTNGNGGAGGAGGTGFSLIAQNTIL